MIGSSFEREAARLLPIYERVMMIAGANHFSSADKPDSILMDRFVSRGQTRDIAQVPDAVLHASLVFWMPISKVMPEQKLACKTPLH